MLQEKSKNVIIECIATFFYSGKSKYMPGTIGSLAAFPFIYLMNIIISNIFFADGLQYFKPEELISLLVYHILVVIWLFALGVYVSSRYIENIGREDPKEVVIDEVVGQYLVVIFCTPAAIIMEKSIHSGFIVLFMFILFRVFDIFKPWPINLVDSKIKGGLGVMLDDVIASIFAILVFYGIFIMFF